MIERVAVAALDAVLGETFSTYDKGFIRVVDYMGGDESIVQAARVSYGKGTKTRSDDRGLIRYLMRHSHTTPFEMCEIKLHVKVEMDTWRQWTRHRTASVNEYSTRYSEAIDDMHVTLPGEWREQATNNKQGSGGFLPLNLGSDLTQDEKDLHAHARHVYQKRLAAGVAKEQARKDLPLSNYTEAYWKIDLHNGMHFLGLRLDAHAQKEIRTYAETMGKIFELWCPLAWEAFNDYNFRRGGLLLSRLDIEVMQNTHLAGDFGWLDRRPDGTLKDNRERQEFEKKMSRLGRKVVWPGS